LFSFQDQVVRADVERGELAETGSRLSCRAWLGQAEAFQARDEAPETLFGVPFDLPSASFAMMSAFQTPALVSARSVNVVHSPAAKSSAANLEVVEVALERRRGAAPSLPPKSARHRSASA